VQESAMDEKTCKRPGKEGKCHTSMSIRLPLLRTSFDTLR
jgi:hypothetical protein